MTVELSARRHGDSRNRGDSHSRREVGFIFAQYVLAAQGELSSSRPAAMALARVAAVTAAAAVRCVLIHCNLSSKLLTACCDAQLEARRHGSGSRDRGDTRSRREVCLGATSLFSCSLILVVA